MKKILLIAVLLGAMLSVTVYFVCIAAPSVLFGKGLKGSGNIVTRTIEAPAFDRIDAARAVKVVITDKTSGKITIAADDNVMDYVVVEANGGRLTATIDKSINNLSNADVTVTVPANGSIRALDASSAAKISGDVVLNADKFAMDASSAAKIDVSVKAQSCAVAASSASKINASVEAVSCSVEASSASKITLKGSAAKCTADSARPRTFGRRLRRRRVLGKHFERGESRRKLHGASARRRIERQFDPLQRRLSDQHQQVERRQCRPQLTPKPSNHERG